MADAKDDDLFPGDDAVSFCVGCNWSSADLSARHECPNDPKVLQAKLEQAERERDEANATLSYSISLREEVSARATAAESALAAAQGALREIAKACHAAPAENAVLDSIYAIARAALAAESGKAEPRAAPPALPAELSGKGEQR